MDEFRLGKLLAAVGSTVCLTIAIEACGGDSSLPTAPTPTSPPAAVAPAPAPTPAPTPAPPPAPTPTPAPSGPRTSFGSGQWRVGTDIAAGRYYTNPSVNCYWERQKGLSGSTNDILANEFIGYDAAQWIVDILPGDLAFETDADCSTWNTTPRAAPVGITPGVWLVGSQVRPGTYRVNARANCYWARLRNFEGGVNGIIANEFTTSAGQQLVTISSSDVGFENDGDCGTWTVSEAPGSAAPQSSASSRSLSIADAFAQHKARQSR